MWRDLLKLFKEFRAERKELLIKERRMRRWVKDQNYEMASQLFAIFTEKSEDVVMELETPNGLKLRIYRDVEGKVREERMTEDELFLGRRG